MDDAVLVVREALRFAPAWSGLFVSRGQGVHPRRVITTWEIIWLVGGSLEMGEGDRRFSMRAGQALLLRPGVEHAGLAPYARDTRFYWIHFSLAGRDERGGEELRVPQLATLARPQAMTALTQRFCEDQSAGRLGPAMAHHLIALMLLELAQPAAPGARDGARGQLARLAHEQIVTRCHERVSTAHIARALGCNADYLGRCYRATYGHGIVEAIHRGRLHRARQLLLDTAQPIERIAAGCGFADALYFRRIFKRHEGMAPAAYRRMHGKVYVNTE